MLLHSVAPIAKPATICIAGNGRASLCMAVRVFAPHANSSGEGADDQGSVRGMTHPDREVTIRPARQTNQFSSGDDQT